MKTKLGQLNYNHLYYFHSVASEGSLANAARRLSVSQSSISEQLKRLEMQLGTQLFARTGGRLRLNEAGSVAYDQTSQMFRAGDRLARLFSHGGGVARTPLTIGASSSVTRLFAARYFTPLFKEDDLHVTFRHGESDLLLHELLRGELDIVLTENHPAEPQSLGLQCSEIACPDLVLVASPQFGAAFKTFPEDLNGLRFIHYAPHSRYRWELDAYFARLEVEPFVVAEVEDVQVMQEAAEQHIAACIIPRSNAIAALEEGRLVELGCAELNKPCISALYREERPTDHVLRAIELMRGPTKQPLRRVEEQDLPALSAAS